MAQGIVVNPEQLMQLKATFDREGGSVAELSNTLGGQLDSTVWEGRVADTFREEWHSQYAPTLQKLSEALQQAGVDVQGALNRALTADGQA